MLQKVKYLYYYFSIISRNAKENCGNLRLFSKYYAY